jgi:S1-C subfamily serine protease
MILLSPSDEEKNLMSETLKQLSEGLANIVESASQGIVRVEGRRRLPATGVVWAENIIVTAHHVVERNENIKIGLPSGETIEASIVGRDPNTDIAVLRVQATLQPLAKSGEGLRVGHLVLALGRPAKDVQATLGVVSAIGANQLDEETNPWSTRAAERAQKRAEKMAERAARRWGGAYSFSFSTGSSGVKMEGAIQTDVVMYPGFSGGPLVDAGGVVRGMNTSAISRGASLTVPVATIDRVVNTLLQHGKMRQGFLGIGAQPVRLQPSIAEQIGQETGLLLVGVEAGSPAENGGLFIGDIIVALDGQGVRHLDELLALLNGDRVGKPVTVHVVRGGQVQEVNVTVGERI